MLYKLTTKDVREDNDNIDCIPEFEPLSSREFKYIALVYDYDTPLRNLKLEDRKERGCELSGYKRESPKRMDKSARKIMGANGGLKHVEKAIPVYKSLQRDIDREALMAYDNQLQQFIDKAAEPKSEDNDWKLAITINKELPKMLQMRADIKGRLDLRVDFESATLGVEEEKEEGVEELSALDRRNQAKIDGEL